MSTTSQSSVASEGTVAKHVYRFGEGKADGSAAMGDLLGGKGAGLAEMTNLGIPVPPGFTITTEVCGKYYTDNNQYPAGLEQQVKDGVAFIEAIPTRLGSSVAPPSRWKTSRRRLSFCKPCPAVVSSAAALLQWFTGSAPTPKFAGAWACARHTLPRHAPRRGTDCRCL